MSQMNVGTKVIFGSPSSERQLYEQRSDDMNVWATDVHEVARGVFVARTILPDRASEVPVQLFNVTNRPVAWKSWAVLGNLERLHAYSAQSPSPPRQQAPADVENQIVDEMMSKVDPSVTDEYKVKLRQQFSGFQSLTALTRATHDLSVNCSDAIHQLTSTLFTNTCTTCKDRASSSHVSRPGLQILCWLERKRAPRVVASTTDSLITAPWAMPTPCCARTCDWKPLLDRAGTAPVIFAVPIIKWSWTLMRPIRLLSSPEGEYFATERRRLDWPTQSPLSRDWWTWYSTCAFATLMILSSTRRR